jgi:hypothetical protein
MRHLEVRYLGSGEGHADLPAERDHRVTALREGCDYGYLTVVEHRFGHYLGCPGTHVDDVELEPFDLEGLEPSDQDGTTADTC